MNDLVSCLECKKKISSTARVCPHCGSTIPNNAALFAWSLAIIAGVVFLYWAL